MLARYRFFCSGVPKCAITSAAPNASPGYMVNAAFAPERNSSTTACMVYGAPCPPNSSGADSPFHPASYSAFQTS
jgi:hypothetical protein